MTNADPTALAAGLSEAQRKALLALLPTQALMVSELPPSTNGLAVSWLFTKHPDLVEREKIQWVDGKRSGWAYQYRLTARGLAVRQSLTDRDGEG